MNNELKAELLKIIAFTDADELELFIDNDSFMYTFKMLAYNKLVKLKKEKKFKKDVAAKVFIPMITKGLGEYKRQIKKTLKLTPADKKTLTKHWVEEFEDEYKLGNITDA